MKILFDHISPFFLAHGGFQTQIEQTKAALEQVGTDVEYVRWWDEKQNGDIIHFFGRPSGGYIDFAHRKKMKVVVAELHTGMGSRSRRARLAQKFLMNICQCLLPAQFLAKLSWEAYQQADAIIAGTPWEATLIRQMFGAPENRLHIVPNGVEEVFFQNSEKLKDRNSERGNYLVCTATITERKRVLELAEAAVLAKTPLWIIGKPYSESDPYYQRFLALHQANPQLVRFEGPISDRACLSKIYKTARGFVLLSSMETRSLSSEEAAAAECPLLLSNLPWARSVFAANASYCPITNDTLKTASVLRKFHEAAPEMPPPPKPLTWRQVAGQLNGMYAEILKT